jgi:protein-tyrosine phosphatase
MIDWHSHILPAMDDGSKSVSESLAMLRFHKEQGITCVIATPHFNANQDTVGSFLSRRTRSYEKLCEGMAEKNALDFPHVVCGAEVQYYLGISRLSDIDRLSLGSSKLLLLEMPMAKWSGYEVREVIELSRTSGLTLVLAHIDRYMPLQKPGIFDEFCENGILMQVNASFFDGLWTRKKAFRWLEEGRLHFLGSDCHNLTSRPPKIEAAYAYIRRKFGRDLVENMTAYGYRMLGLNGEYCGG